MFRLRAIVGLGIGLGSSLLSGLNGGSAVTEKAQAPRAEHGNATAEDEAHFRAIQKARRELQILEAQVALKKAEIQKAEAEYMLRHLQAAAEDHAPPADPARKSAAEDGPVQEALDRAIVMPFPDPTPLDEVLRYVKEATRRPGLPGGLPIFVDPEALKAARQSMESRVVVCHDGIPLRKALSVALEPLGLAIHVKDGLVVVHASKPAPATAPAPTPPAADEPE